MIKIHLQAIISRKTTVFVQFRLGKGQEFTGTQANFGPNSKMIFQIILKNREQFKKRKYEGLYKV